MARQKTSPVEDLVIVISKLPWWIGVALALVSYLVLHSYASRPSLPPATGPGQLGAVAMHGVYRAFALFGQYVLPFAFGLGALISATNLAKQKKLYDHVAKRSGTAVLHEMHWEDFERLVSEYYRRQGFRVTRRGGNGPDGGIDLVLNLKGEVYLVQCKQWKAFKVGVQPVREFYGVMASRGVAGGYFVTSGEYTNEAKAFAQGLNLELVDGRKLREMIGIAQQPILTRVAPGPDMPHEVEEAKLRADFVASSIAPASPICPRCNAEMTMRVARHGSNAGKEFWGCVSYPKCKGTRPFDESTTDETPTSKKALPEKSNCPDCGSDMALRQFQSGPRSGEQFYGCIPCKKGWTPSQVC
jgi:restriction system protein